MNAGLNSERIIIFGGTGSLGRKLIERFAGGNHVLVFSRDEAKHWTIRNEHPHLHRLQFAVGDIRDRDRVREVVWSYSPTRIIIAAALKQVDTCEGVPSESIATNVTGTQNVISAVRDYTRGPRGVDILKDDPLKVLFVSTDKACSPVNVYGMCKALSERLITSAPDRCPDVEFLCTRYGNVLESRGSIVPLFKYQAEHSNELTVTNPDMTRFVMTLDDSVNLIETAFCRGRSGDTWIPQLPSMRIGDLAEIFSELSGKPISVTGPRPGEKVHEDLINEVESSRTHTEHDGYYVISPTSVKPFREKSFTYTSADNVMKKEQLRQHLLELGILDAPLEAFKGRQIEEIRR